MDAINNVESRKDSMFEDQSPFSLYIIFFITTIAFLLVKYQILTGSIIAPVNSSEEWKYKTGRTTGLNLIYLFTIILSQIGLLIFQSNSICGNYDNALQVLAQGGTTWGIIFTMIFVFINFLFSSWKGPFSNTFGYEISSRVFNLEKKEQFLANLLNDPKNVGNNAPKNLVNILTKILVDKDKKSVRQLINGITLDDFTVFINKSISEKIVRNPFKSKSGGKKQKRKTKRGGAQPETDQTQIDSIKSEQESQDTIINNAKQEQQAEEIASKSTENTEQTDNTSTSTPENVETEIPDTTENLSPSPKPEPEPEPDAPSTDNVAETEPKPNAEDVESSVMSAISTLFQAICLKDIISEFIWLSLAGSLSVLVSYTFLLQQKCNGNQPLNISKIVEENVNEDPIIKKTQNEIKKRSKLTDKKLREEKESLQNKKIVIKEKKKKESFTMLNDSNNNNKSFNKKFKTDDFWLGQPYKSSLELGDYNVNTSKEKRDIENRISEQGLTFLKL